MYSDILNLLVKKDVGNLKKLFNIRPELVNTCNMQQHTLLHFLVVQGYPIPLLQIAVELGVNAALLDVHGNTALHYAAQRREHLAPLLQAKNSTAALNTLDKEWNTPLHMVCSYNRMNLLPLVLRKQNLKIDERNENGTRAQYCGNKSGEDKRTSLFSIYREKGWYIENPYSEVSTNLF